MAQINVRYHSGSAASGIEVAISFYGGAMKQARTNRDGRVVISGSSNSGKIFVRGREVHNGNLSGAFEFYI